MKFSEIVVSESFDSNVKGRLIRATNNLFTTRATIGNRDIVFNATAITDDTDDNKWEIEFTERSDGNMTYGKSGSGNEMQVFSFVIESIKELIARYSPAEIEFGSDKADNNRSTLYNRMIQRIKIPGYHPAGTESSPYTDIFRIVRDK